MVPILEFHSSLQTTKFVGVVVGEGGIAGSSSAGGAVLHDLGEQPPVPLGPPHPYREILQAWSDPARGLQYPGPVMDEGQGVVDHEDGPQIAVS